jgi:GNAT superfamily N-acetyltransferase
MIFVALDEAARKGELQLMDGGMCRWHLRRDGVVVIREIIVLPGRRRQGVGRRLVEAVQAANPGRTLRAKCPAAYEANGFWRHMGFALAASEKGANLWERRP